MKQDAKLKQALDDAIEEIIQKSSPIKGGRFDSGLQIETRTAYGIALKHLGGVDERVIALTADLAPSDQSQIFEKQYPERFFNEGVAEAGMVGRAAGFSLAGYVPFASSFSMFVFGRAWESVRQNVALPNANVKLFGSHHGLTVGEDGASHQMTEDYALLRVLPNMVVVHPADGIEMAYAVFAAAQHKGPVAIIGNRSRTPLLYRERVEKGEYKFEFGKWDILYDSSSSDDFAPVDVSLFAAGVMVPEMYDVIHLLEQNGTKVALLNASSIKPIPHTLILRYIRNSELACVVEEHQRNGGLYEAVCSSVAPYGNASSIIPFCIDDQFGESGKKDDLFKKFRLDAQHIAKFIGH